jgi:MFS family permease
MYSSRAVLIALYLVAPRNEWTLSVRRRLGFTWLATVPPTASIVGKLFGIRHLSTLFGLTLLSHQVGGFLGAWLGGIALTRFGDYRWMWYADMVLAVFAALVNLPIREASPRTAARGALSAAARGSGPGLAQGRPRISSSASRHDAVDQFLAGRDIVDEARRPCRSSTRRLPCRLPS